MTTRTYKPEDNLNMNKTWANYTRFSIWIIPHWRRIQASLLNPAPLGIAIFRRHVIIYITRYESRTRYFRDGNLIIGAAKLIDLDNYIKIFRGYFTKYIHASTLFSFQHEHFSLKANARLKYMNRLKTKPTKWPLRPGKTRISLGMRPVWS